MSGVADFGSLVRGNLHYLPVVPGRIEFAAHVRRALLILLPQAVAIELPAWLGPAYLEAIDRLPEITAIVYPEDADSERGIYLIIEPTDACVEAVRTAREIGAARSLSRHACGQPHRRRFLHHAVSPSAVAAK
jgi:hypothetical protein